MKKKSKTVEVELTPAQKRVAIAQDILEQLKARKMVATYGKYIGCDFIKKILSKAGRKENKKKDLQSSCKRLEECEVCARGAMALSAVKLFNNFTFGEARKVIEAGEKKHLNGSASLVYALEGKEYFSKRQSILMEYCFERNLDPSMSSKTRLTDKEKSNCILFLRKCFEHVGFGSEHSKFNNADLVLEFIMQNVVANRGTFAPHKTAYLAKQTPLLVGI